jgi:SPP1 gp7 family putative phage head morphogenesis protein
MTQQLRLPTKKAETAIQRAIVNAMRKMERAAEKYLVAGPQMQRWAIAQMTEELERLAQQHSLDAVRGPYGQMIIDSANKGYRGGLPTETIPGTMLAMDTASIEIALHNAQVHIKDITSAGVKKINEIIASGIVQGQSQKQLARAIRSGLSSTLPMAKARAQLIARSELMSAYRQGAMASMKETGYKYFQMVGPQPGDARIEPICEKHVNSIKTRKGWEAIHPLALIYGLHYGCRHQWIPVATREG